MTTGQASVILGRLLRHSVQVTYLSLHPLLLAGVGGVGVYVAQVSSGADVYVGSVHRPHNMDGIAQRIREHQAADVGAVGSRRWTGIHVFALGDTSPEIEVRMLEGVVGRIIAPTQNRRLPRVGVR